VVAAALKANASPWKIAVGDLHLIQPRVTLSINGMSW